MTPDNLNEPYADVRVAILSFARCGSLLNGLTRCSGLTSFWRKMRSRRRSRLAMLMMSRLVGFPTRSKSALAHAVAVPKAYAQRVCSMFAQLGARGVSVLVASGDDGTGDGNPDPKTSTLCTSNDGTNRTTFIPKFPASCP